LTPDHHPALHDEPRSAALLIGLTLIVPGALADAPRPECNAYVRGLAARQRQRAEVLDTYTYDLISVREDLDGKGGVTRRRTQTYQTFFVGGRPIRRLVSEDGRPLDARQQQRADRDAEEKAEAIRKGQATEERPGARLLTILERFDFRATGREEVDGRPAIVLDFVPQPGKRDIEGDAALRHLVGRLWVDEAEREIVRAEVRNQGPIKLAWGLGATVSSLESRTDFRKVDGAAWLPVRDQTTASGRVLLLKRFRTRVTRSYGNYRKFEVDVQETVPPS
jgi:hypothetical protein